MYYDNYLSRTFKGLSIKKYRLGWFNIKHARSTDSTIKINIYKINTAGIDFFF